MFVTSVPPLRQGSWSGHRLALHVAHDDEGVVDDISLGLVFDLGERGEIGGTPVIPDTLVVFPEGF